MILALDLADAIKLHSPITIYPHSHVALPRALSSKNTHQPGPQAIQVLGIAYLEKEPNNKDLQTSHAHHHQALNHAEVEDPPLGASNRAEIPILARAEVLLVAGDG